MRSVTSCFNGPLFRKNMARFWPIWVSYGVMWFFLIPMQFFTISGSYGEDAARRQARLLEYAVELPDLLGGGMVMSVCFGLAAAMAVFSYLFFARSACMMHSLPLSRNTLFATNYLSGLAFLVLPNLAIVVVTIGVELLFSCLMLEPLLTWLWVQCATGLFFYSFAVFCAMFTGNLFALPAFYGILNALVLAVTIPLDEVLRRFYHGYDQSALYNQDVVYWLTPTVKLAESCGTYTARPVTSPVDPAATVAYSCRVSDPTAILLYVVVAVALTAAALWVYQRRHVESAGDVVSVPIVRPVFKIGVAVCAGLCCGLFSSAVLGFYSESALIVLAAIWTVVGAFVAEMLLRKSFRVLNTWKSAAALGLVMVLAFVGIQRDWFGYQRWMPQAEQVETVLVRMDTGAPYDSGSYPEFVVDSPEEIVKILALHELMTETTDQYEGSGDDYVNQFRVVYGLTNGQTASRRYSGIPVLQSELDVPGTLTQAYHDVLTDPAMIRKFYEVEERNQKWILQSAYVESLTDINGKYREEVEVRGDMDALWLAVQQDITEGNLGRRYLFANSEERQENTCRADLVLVWRQPKTEKNELIFTQTYSEYIAVENDPDMRYEHYSITLTPHAVHTLKVLEEQAGLKLGVDILTFAQLEELEHQG